VTLSTDGSTLVNYTANQGLHYVVGLPTPVMPTSGSASYTLAGATSPTYVSGATGPGSFAGTINVTFGTTGNIDGNFRVTMPDAAYSWNWRTTTSAQFTASSAVTGCSSTACSATVNGFFAGPSAERIGVGYHVNDSQANKTLLGAAAFKN